MNTSKEDRIVRILQLLLVLLNVLAVSIISGFIFITTEHIRSHYTAREFLDSVNAIPGSPRNMFIACVTGMGMMVILFILRIYLEKYNNSFVIWTLFFDVIIVLIVMYQLNFNYNGLILLVFAEGITFVKNHRMKLFLVAFAMLGYLVANYDFLALRFSLFNVLDYIRYYSSDFQQYFLSTYNILLSLNVIIFIAYCVYVMNSQSNTIEEVNHLYKELQSANEQLQEYANMSEKMAQTKERNRLAREIHDTLGHTLTGIVAGLDACMTIIDISPEQTKKQLEILSKVSRDGIKDIRRSVSELKPDSLERLHLEVAIRKMITDMSQVSGANIYFETEEKKLRFDEDEENAIYRVIQESITNALRHGKATKIWITMVRENGDMKLTIKDNGIGCKEIVNGFGTKHIEERIEMLHGTVNFDGNNGFTVSAVIPIRWGENYD